MGLALAEAVVAWGQHCPVFERLFQEEHPELCSLEARCVYSYWTTWSGDLIHITDYVEAELEREMVVLGWVPEVCPSANPGRPPGRGGQLETDPGAHRSHHQVPVYSHQRNCWGCFWTSPADPHQALD